MPTAGLEIRNDSGYLLITQDYSSFQLKQKGSGTLTSTTFGAGTVGTASFTVTGLRYPVLAVSVAYPNAFRVATKNNGGGSFTFYIYSAGASTGTAYSYWLFDSADLASTSDRFGLEVFNASGQRVYHSSLGSMRIGGLINGSGVLNLTSGRTYAVAFSGFHQQFQSIYFAPLTYSNLNTFSAATINGPQVNLGTDVYESYVTSTQQAQTDIGTASIVVLDVTGY
jgi:hypothetical protein